ncbi:MAG: CDP-alcohol phosphatidyltransferase family protein [Candidatus ainarchaeum sp.]|nr:CDP-alcohol phosphatidyltransferase family protein [Candidatus ainarchaeum sp.]
MLKNKINSDKLLSFFSIIPLHPNHITIISVITAIFAFFIFYYDPLISIVLFCLSFFIDALDGVVARAKNLISKKGAFLDGISDRLVEFILLLLLILNFGSDQLLLICFTFTLFFGTCMTSFIKAYSHHQGLLSEKDSKKMSGILERAERVILLIITYILLIYYPIYSLYSAVLIAIFSFITFIQRLFYILSK